MTPFNGGSTNKSRNKVGLISFKLRDLAPRDDRFQEDIEWIMFYPRMRGYHINDPRIINHLEQMNKEG